MGNIAKFIPNSITGIRIFMAFAFTYVILGQPIDGKEKFITLITIFLGICISDLLDGKIARKMEFTSAIGAKFDVAADLTYIIFSYTALIILKVLPIWFLGFVCLKFLEFTMTSMFIKKYNKRSNNPFVFDKVGRVVSAIFFVIPGIVCTLNYLFSYIAGDLTRFLLYLTFAGGIYSSYIRIKSCFIMLSLDVNKCIG